ncbi:MAG: histidinol-phosphate transaminase [Planctomycetaceae bacterium]|nr:histidinol-phosphate transaminase [Planctomycetaceae bacterium]
MNRPFRVADFVRPHLLQVAGYVPGEQPQGGKFIKLNTNENPYPPSPKVLAALADFSERLRKYPDPTATAFRRLAAQVLNVSPDQIVCGNGSDEILALIVRLFLGPDDVAAWAKPTYLLYETLVRLQGARFRSFDYQPNWNLPTELFESDAKLIFIANPNSPSGTCFSLPELREIIERATCPIVIDEAYSDYAGQSAATLVPDYPHLLVSRTLSKSYALAGLRFGYVVANEEIVAHLHTLRDSYNCDAVSIALATAAVGDQDWLRENVQKVVSERQMLEVSLRALGWTVQPSQANFLWCQHPQQKEREIYQELKNRQILVRFMDYGSPWVGLRITVGTPQQNQVLLGQLEQIMKSFS